MTVDASSLHGCNAALVALPVRLSVPRQDSFRESFILRRLGFYAIAAWASLTLNFFLPRLMPGDPASVIFARAQGRMQPETIEAMKKAYGLSDDPLPHQYFNYLGPHSLGRSRYLH